MSMMTCDSCTALIDTDEVPEAFLASGEVVLCLRCSEDKEVVVTSLYHARAALEAQAVRLERTDNAYANSGLMEVYARRILKLSREIRAASSNFYAWMEKQT